MFGFATKKDWNRWIAKANKEINDEMVARYQHIRAELLEQLEKLKPKAETPQAPEPVETHGKLWTITISKDGAPHPERYVWNDCTRYDWECYFDGTVSGINILFKNGATVYKTGRWNVEMTEQKPEGVDVYTPAQAKAIRDAQIREGALEFVVEVLRTEVNKLNHRIEMLELRLNGADKQAKPQAKPKSK